MSTAGDVCLDRLFFNSLTAPHPLERPMLAAVVNDRSRLMTAPHPLERPMLAAVVNDRSSSSRAADARSSG